MPGVYESFTCTVQNSIYTDVREATINNFTTRDSFKLQAGETSYYNDYDASDYVYVDDWDFAGWRSGFEVDQITTPT